VASSRRSVVAALRLPNGNLALSGFLDSAQMIVQPLADARSVEGARSIQNNLTVR